MRAVALVIVAAVIAGGASAQERPVGTEARTDLFVTVYNADLALVQDRRRVELGEAPVRLAFEDVSARIRPETAILSGENVAVIEQVFDGRVVDQRRLLEAYEGETVDLVRTHPTTGEETREPARIVSVHDGVVLEIDGRIETGIPGRLVFPAIPEGLRTRPTLVAQVDPDRGTSSLELAYLSQGLHWQTDYIATLDPGETRLTLAAWATVTNVSGTDYPDARLRLVAGDVNLAGDSGAARRLQDMPMAEAMAAPAPPQEQAISDLRIYDYPHRVTLHNDEVKQLALFTAPSVTMAKEYRIYGGQRPYTSDIGEPRPEAVTVRLVLDNTADAGLGRALPRGVVRVYRAGPEGGLFLGEATMPDTPEGGTARLDVGRAFDVQAERRQTDYVRINQPRNSFETAHAIALTNAKDEPVTVVVVEAIPGDWEMLEESHPHTQTGANRAEWRIEVPAAGDAELRYRVRVRM